MTKQRYVLCNELGENNQHYIRAYPVEEAIAMMRSRYNYETDDEALIDFVVVHWGWLVETVEKPL